MKAPKPFNSLHQMVYWLSRVGDLSTTDFVSFGIFTSPEGSKKLTKNSPTNRKGWRRLEYLVGPSLSKKPIKHNDLSGFGEGRRSIEQGSGSGQCHLNPRHRGNKNSPPNGRTP